MNKLSNTPKHNTRNAFDYVKFAGIGHPLFIGSGDSEDFYLLAHYNSPLLVINSYTYYFLREEMCEKENEFAAFDPKLSDYYDEWAKLAFNKINKLMVLK
jgi:hypothetical protein